MSETAVEDEEATTEQLLELVREAFSSCEGDAVPLTTLGDKVRSLAVRRTLHNTHKQIKDKFGGWEAFLRMHAALEFSVVSGVVRARQQSNAIVDEMEAQPVPRSSEPSRESINELSLDAAQL